MLRSITSKVGGIAKMKPIMLQKSQKYLVDDRFHKQRHSIVDESIIAVDAPRRYQPKRFHKRF
jgi:hypothetical protein